MARIHLIEGPVGAGKSTLAAQLAKRYSAPRIILDDWMATLFSPDRPATGLVEWYTERKERCLEQIWKVTGGLLDAGGDAVLELGLIHRQSRQDFYERMESAGYEYTVYVLDAEREVRRERVRARNVNRGSTFSMEVPDQFFEMASNMWEPVDEIEAEGRDVHFISTDN